MENQILILGGGICASRISENLSRRNIPVLKANDDVCERQAGSHDSIKPARVVKCTGYAGDFCVTLAQAGQSTSVQVAAIVVAMEGIREPNFRTYGLAPSDSVWDLPKAEEKIRVDIKLAEPSIFTHRRIALFNGWQKDSHPVVTARMLNLCLKLQRQTGAQTFFLTGNLKVGGNGLEHLYQEAKQAGTIFVKCTDRFPEIKALSSGQIHITYWEELTREPFEMKTDLVVVDETLHPDPMLTELAQALGLEQDQIGFSQSDNVRRLSNLTNRRGIFVAGLARAVMTHEEQISDADHLSLEIVTFLSNKDQEALPGSVQIHPGRCARCLTCHRLCPHWAIAIGPKIQVVPQACHNCGICAAGCPGRAIELSGVQIKENLQHLSFRISESDDGFVPQLAVFCCSRSAGQARNLSVIRGKMLPAGVRVIEVPCGGSIAVHHLLAAFDAGADGVLIFTCHQDNCLSQVGSDHAQKRQAAALQILEAAGMETDRLQRHTVAANMGNEFFKQVEDFHLKIKLMGPWGPDNASGETNTYSRNEKTLKDREFHPRS